MRLYCLASDESESTCQLTLQSSVISWQAQEQFVQRRTLADLVLQRSAFSIHWDVAGGVLGLHRGARVPIHLRCMSFIHVFLLDSLFHCVAGGGEPVFGRRLGTRSREE